MIVGQTFRKLQTKSAKNSADKQKIHTEKTVIEFAICDKEPKTSYTAKISKIFSQITLVDIKNLILQRFQNFGRRTSPRVDDSTYLAKTIKDVDIEWQEIDIDSDIVPSFHNGKENKIEIICVVISEVKINVVCSFKYKIFIVINLISNLNFE